MDPATAMGGAVAVQQLWVGGRRVYGFVRTFYDYGKMVREFIMTFSMLEREILSLTNGYEFRKAIALSKTGEVAETLRFQVYQFSGLLKDGQKLQQRYSRGRVNQA